MRAWAVGGVGGPRAVMVRFRAGVRPAVRGRGGQVVRRGGAVAFWWGGERVGGSEVGMEKGGGGRLGRAGFWALGEVGRWRAWEMATRVESRIVGRRAMTPFWAGKRKDCIEV